MDESQRALCMDRERVLSVFLQSSPWYLYSEMLMPVTQHTFYIHCASLKTGSLNLWCMWCVRLRPITQLSCFQSCTAHSLLVLDNSHELTRVHVPWVLRLQVSSSLCTRTKSPVLQMWVSRVQVHRVLGCRLEGHTGNAPLVVGIYLSFSHTVHAPWVLCYSTEPTTVHTQLFIWGTSLNPSE